MKTNLLKRKKLQFVVVVCVITGLLTGCGNTVKEESIPESKVSETTAVAENTVNSESEQNKAESIILPYLIKDGKLTVGSIFPSAILNPDCNDEENDSAASLEVTNTSTEYLNEVELDVVLTDGTYCHFSAKDIPAGKTAWLFDISNQSIELNAEIANIECTAEFTESDPLMSDTFAVETEGTLATIKNLSDSDKDGYTVSFHCLFDGVYFGGTTYIYELGKLPAGKSAEIDAVDCYLGEAELVSIREQ